MTTENSFAAELKHRLEALRAEGLHRALQHVDSPQAPCVEIGGRTYLNFSSNDYLGLANEPSLKAAAIRAIEKFGAGSGASRLVSGSLVPHHELEESLAAFKGVEAALTFSSGYATALGAIGALLDKTDVIVIDKLVHACIVDAARLSGAKLRVFRHNDLNNLERILLQSTPSVSPEQTPRRRRILIVTESIFSMDGDRAPLRELVELKEKYGAWLMVDEAHATGLFGPHRCGLAEELGVADQIEIQMGTLGKAIGSAGGYVCGSRALIDYLINRARSFIFSTAPVPAAAAAATAGIQFIQAKTGAERSARLWDRVQELNSQIRTGAAASLTSQSERSAIIPWIIGDETKTVEATTALRSHGLFIPAIRYPTVARGTARLRITLTAAHTTDDVHQLVAALTTLFPIPNSAFPTPHSTNEPIR